VGVIITDDVKVFRTLAMTKVFSHGLAAGVSILDGKSVPPGPKSTLCEPGSSYRLVDIHRRYEP
jgi:hypothetical protein